MRAVPVEGPPGPLPQIHARLPAEPLANLGRVEVLPVDFSAESAASLVVGLDIGRPELADQLDHLANRVGPAPAGVEGLAAGSPRGERVGEREVGTHSVVDMEEITR